MAHLRDFGHRSNVNTFQFRGKQIFVYTDHRTILNVIFFALKNNLIDNVPNVLYFDYHDDACVPKASILAQAPTFDINIISEQDFNNIVEYGMSIQDDDWVKSGMEFGLINNAISVGAESLRTSHEIYTDVRGHEHEIIGINHLSHSLGVRGAFCDTQVESESYFEPVREIFDFNNSVANSWGANTESFVLDFDLDCFAGTFNGETLMAWPEKMFYQEFHNNVGFQGNQLPLDFINNLIDKCEFITICMEPGCCGGFGESFKILSYLDKYFFEGTLKTEGWF